MTSVVQSTINYIKP